MDWKGVVQHPSGQSAGDGKVVERLGQAEWGCLDVSDTIGIATKNVHGKKCDESMDLGLLTSIFREKPRDSNGFFLSSRLLGACAVMGCDTGLISGSTKQCGGIDQRLSTPMIILIMVDEYYLLLL